jgi:signal transduction histidine kinase
VHLDERYAAERAEVLPGQYVMLAVTDNGSGMPPEVKAKAFDPFLRPKTSDGEQASVFRRSMGS